MKSLNFAAPFFAALAGTANADLLYTQNFDSMGAAGTAAPSGWAVYSLPGSHDSFRFAGSRSSITTTILPSDSPTMINNGGNGAAVLQGALTAATPSNQRAAGGFNFGLAASPGDRALGSSPTGSAGTELQLSLTNNDGGPLSAVTVSYDIRRFSTTVVNNSGYTGPDVGLEELPGYWLFYSLNNGASWTNISSLNPTKAGPTGVIVPNTVGVSSIVNASFTLSSPLSVGSTIQFRWFDDNAQSPSPDQLIGLDNVSISMVPAPGAAPVLAIGVLALRRRRR